MMLLRKDVVLLIMKLVTVLFLIFMITKVAKLFVIPDELELNEEEKLSNKSIFEDDIINKPYFFHIFAFVLGAFWNIKRIVKIGIM